MSDKKTERKKFTDWKKMVWVLNNLDTEQLSHMDALDFDYERYVEFLEILVDSGFDLKITYDTWSGCYQVSVMGAWQNFPNTGYATSGRSNELIDAFKIIWYKLEVVAQGDLSQFETAERDNFRG